MTKNTDTTPAELQDAELDNANGGIIAILIGLKDGDKRGHEKKRGAGLVSMAEGETCGI